MRYALLFDPEAKKYSLIERAEYKDVWYVTMADFTEDEGNATKVANAFNQDSS